MLKIHSLYENPMYNSHIVIAKINFIITCKYEKGLKRIGDDEIDYILYVNYSQISNLVHCLYPYFKSS